MSLTIGIISTCLGTEEFYHKCQRESELIENRLKSVRPNWHFKSYRAYVREFPKHINSCDGYVFSGSPVSVNAKDGWVADTLDYIRELYAAEKSMIGICFGHQAIAKALGGQVELSPKGWSVGAVKVKFFGQTPWMQPWKEILRLYAVHNEQVVIPPKGSVILGKTDSCPIASFCIGNHVFTTQHHPEMTSEFISSVVDHLTAELDTDIIHRARTSLGYGDDNDRFSEWMANFLESKDR
jgi:GMP synthase-like glutamine amidotransferase